MAIIYPKTIEEPRIVERAGIKYKDRFHWLESEDETKTWVAEENALTDRILSQIPGRERIQKRLEELLNRDTIRTTCPKYGDVDIRSRGDVLFYAKRKAVEEQYSLYAYDLKTREERLLVDLNKPEFEGRLSLGRIDPSPDGKLVVYEVSTEGDSFAELQVLDVSSRKVIDRIPRTFYPYPAWMPGNIGFFYSRSTEKDANALRQWGLKAHFHKLGNKWEEDKVVCGQEVPDNVYVWISEVSENGKIAIVSQLKDPMINELLYLDLSNPDSKPVSITGNEKARFESALIGDFLYLLTDHKAPRSKLGRIRLDGKCPKLENLEIVVEEGKGFLTGVSSKGDITYITRKIDASYRLFSLNKEGVETELALESPRSTHFIGNGNNPMVMSQSFLDPLAIYPLDGLKLEPVLTNGDGIDHNLYMVEQLWTKSRDGTRIPMSVVRKKDTPLNGKNPTLLYGYGGFGGGVYPIFSDLRLFWLEHGGIVVSANIRGGDEFGRAWHEAAKLDKKPNAIDDLLVCAESLQGLRKSRKTGEWEYKTRHYTGSTHLGLIGESNGGLIAGAAVVQRPDLFGAVVLRVPLADMPKFDSTDAGKGWLEEYGNPDDPADLEKLLTYSPYQNVHKADYPPMHISTAFKDTQGVASFQAMKVTAAIQKDNTSKHPILLRVREKIGHGYGESLQQNLQRSTEEHVLLAHFLGLKGV